MRKLPVLVVLIVLACIAYANRERIFWRDPMGSVVRNGMKEPGAQVYENYAGDAMIENDNAPMYFDVLVHGLPVSAPTSLKCIHYLICLAAGRDELQTLAVPGAKMESMTAQAIRFRDADGRETVVALR